MTPSERVSLGVRLSFYKDRKGVLAHMREVLGEEESAKETRQPWCTIWPSGIRLAQREKYGSVGVDGDTQ